MGVRAWSHSGDASIPLSSTDPILRRQLLAAGAGLVEISSVHVPCDDTGAQSPAGV